MSIEYATTGSKVGFSCGSARTCTGCGVTTRDAVLLAKASFPAPTGAEPVVLCGGCIRHGLMAARSAHRGFIARMKERGIG